MEEPNSPQSEMVDSGYDEMSTLDSIRDEIIEEEKEKEEITEKTNFYVYALGAGVILGVALVYLKSR